MDAWRMHRERCVIPTQLKLYLNIYFVTYTYQLYEYILGRYFFILINFIYTRF